MLAVFTRLNSSVRSGTRVSHEISHFAYFRTSIPWIRVAVEKVGGGTMSRRRGEERQTNCEIDKTGHWLADGSTSMAPMLVASVKQTTELTTAAFKNKDFNTLMCHGAMLPKEDQSSG